MPLRPAVRPLYGHAWRAFRDAFAAEVPPVCGECGARREKGMNLAHRTHDPLRRDRLGLAWKCPTCHAIHDTPQRIAMTRRTKARKVGQLWLLPEIEYAPYPLWEIPDELLAEVLKALQEDLFE
jgi:hypothetical protein